MPDNLQTLEPGISHRATELHQLRWDAVNKKVKGKVVVNAYFLVYEKQCQPSQNFIYLFDEKTWKSLIDCWSEMGIYSGEGWYMYFPLAFVVTVAGQDTFGAGYIWSLSCSAMAVTVLCIGSIPMWAEYSHVIWFGTIWNFVQETRIS